MKIDIHTHVLPGVDHGAENWDISLKMLAKSARCGIKAVIATPHYLPWKKSVTPELICERCREAEKRLQKEYGYTMDIYPGNEIYYGTDTVELLKAGKVLSLGKSCYVLIEFSEDVAYQTICAAVRNLQFYGYNPIIAHVERYQCLKQTNKLKELKNMGALAQVNIGSFQGGLFDERSNRVKRWLRDEWIDFVASDMHDMEKRQPMAAGQLMWLQKKLSLEYQDKLLYGNAQRILADMKA